MVGFRKKLYSDRLPHKFLRGVLVFVLIFSWVFSGFPYPYFDNERGDVAVKHSIQTAQAALPTTITGITIAPLLLHGGPFVSSAGNVYYVGRSSTDAAAVRVVKATDPTASFSTAATDTAGDTAILGLDVKQNGDDLHILTQEDRVTGVGDIAYRRFSMSSDTFTLGYTVVTVDPSTKTTTQSQHCSLARRSDGDLIAIYGGDASRVKGTDYDRLRAKVSTDNGATWGTEFEYSAGTGVEANYRRPSCEIGDSDTLHCVYAQGVNLMQRAMSSADVLQTERDTTFDVTRPAAGTLSIGKGATFSRSATTRLRFPFRENIVPETEVLRFDAAAGPSVFAADTVDINPKVGGNLQLALDGSTVYAMWVRSADNDLYSANDQDTNTWTTPASSFVGTVTLISANIYTRAGSKVLAHVFDDAGTVKYDEDTLASAAKPASLIQHAYKWFANTDGTAVGGAAGGNSPTIAPKQGTPFRLRLLLYNEGGTSIGVSGTTTDLMIALKDSDGICDGDETYSEVQSASGVIRYYNNATPVDGNDLTASSFDPVATSSAVTVRNQDYEESNTFTNSVAAIGENEAGLWDFSLVDSAAPPDTTYCFRAMQDEGGTNFVLSGYNAFPEISTAKPLTVRLRAEIRLRTVRLR